MTNSKIETVDATFGKVVELLKDISNPSLVEKQVLNCEQLMFCLEAAVVKIGQVVAEARGDQLDLEEAIARDRQEASSEGC